MCTSPGIRVALVCSLLWSLTMMQAGCGRAKTAGEAGRAAGDAGHNAEAAGQDQHHSEPGSVELSPAAMERAQIRMETVRSVASGEVLLAPAELQLDGDRIARVGPRVGGRIARVLVSLGASVRSGQPLATIYSPEVTEARAALDSASAIETLARGALTRERELLERRVSARREVLEAEAAVASAEAAVRAAEARLAAKGFSDSAGRSLSGDSVITVTSPINGTVIERSAAVDAPVGPDSVLFTIADLSSLWLTVHVSETSAGVIHRGQTVSVVVGGIPDRPVNGRVDYIAPMVAPETRTVDVRVEGA